jgi:hypothetical protein
MAHPALDAKLAGAGDCGLAEADALDVAADDGADRAALAGHPAESAGRAWYG